MVGTVVVTDAAGTAPTPGPTTAPPAPVALPTVEGEVVRVIDDDYLPQSLTIDAGTEVTWVNQGVAPHTATDRDGLFDSGVLGRGGTYTRTFDKGGTYEVFCVIHPDMVSHITVKGGAAKPTPRPGGSPTPTATPPPPPAPGSAQMLDFDFAPKTLTVKAGTTITWANLGKAPHTVTANDDAFDSGLKLTGETFTITFKTPGTFGYYCTLHPQMTGTVVVTNAAGEAPPPSEGSGGGGRPAARVPSNPPPPPGANDIRMLDNDFAPGTLTVRAGTTVRWVNAGQVPHTATASGGVFDSGFVNAGGTFSTRISTPGTYSYTCIIHPGMAGRLIVTDAQGQAPPPVSPVPDARPNDTGSDSEGPDDAGTTFEMIDFDYAPRDFTARPGEEILWINTGEAPHTVTARDGSFDSGIVMAGGEFKLVVDKPGIYEYYCALHPQMVGTLTVSDSAEGGNGAPGSGTGDAEPGENPSGEADPGAVASHNGDSGALTALVLLILLVIGAGGLVAVALPLMLANRTATRR
jgi:plastocyanin